MDWHAAAAEVAGVRFDRESGIGAVPDGAEIEHRGATVLMRPSVFLRLAEPLRPSNRRPGSAAFLARALAEGRTIAPATLSVDPPGQDVPGVHGHEGRHRMEAALALAGDVPLPVHLTRPWRRADSMDAAWLDATSRALLDEAGTAIVEGTLFHAAHVRGRTHVLGEPGGHVAARAFRGFAGTRLQADALRLLVEAEPGLALGEAAPRFEDDQDPVLDGLAALGHRKSPDEVGKALAAAARGRPPALPVAALLGAGRITWHAAALPAPGPRP